MIEAKLSGVTSFNIPLFPARAVDPEKADVNQEQKESILALLEDIENHIQNMMQQSEFLLDSESEAYRYAQHILDYTEILIQRWSMDSGLGLYTEPQDLLSQIPSTPHNKPRLSRYVAAEMRTGWRAYNDRYNIQTQLVYDLCAYVHLSNPQVPLLLFVHHHVDYHHSHIRSPFPRMRITCLHRGKASIHLIPAYSKPNQHYRQYALPQPLNRF